MPNPFEPNDPNEGSSSSTSPQQGSSNRAARSLQQRALLSQLNEFGFPMETADHFQVGSLLATQLWLGTVGTVTLASGLATVNTVITANSIVLVTPQQAVTGQLYVTRNVGTGFTITSTAPSDSSLIAYVVIEALSAL